VNDAQVLAGSTLLGRVLAGRYVVRSLLGRGGMGEVYVAHDEVLERDVAIKILPAFASQDPRSLTRLRREARAAAGLAHPNIVAVHDLVVDADLAFIVMELVQGRSLARLLDDGTPLLPALAVRIARDVAEALAYAHARRVTHRDIAPGNVVVTVDGRAKVLDFGLARAEDWTPAFEPSPFPRGTVAYISPEQADGRRGDARSDVYSLGCVLYEMLTGRPPFEGPSPAAIAAQHVHALPVPPTVLRPEIPQGLERVVLRCLLKEPRHRFGSGTELAAALEEPERPQAAVPTRPLRRITRIWPTAPVSTQHGASVPSPRSASRPRVWLAVGAVVAAVLGAFVAIPTGRLLIWPPAGDPLPQRPRPLVAPSGVVAQGVCDGFLRSRVDLSWMPTTSAAAGYDVYRSASASEGYEWVAHVDGREAMTFRDVDLGMGQTYFYVLRSVAGSRLSSLTEPASADTPALCLG
jgi:serine/threonine-protein kinase